MTTIAYKYRIKRVLSDASRVMDEIRNAHRLYNDLVAIERTRREGVRAFWAARGGYTALLDDLAARIEAAQATPKGAERDAAWTAVDDLRRTIWQRERDAIAAQDSAPKARRKARAKELRDAARSRGEKLSASQISAVLDLESDCLTPRDAMRIQLVRDYEARGVKPSAKKIAATLRDAGLVGPTEQIEAAARDAAYQSYLARGVTPGTRGLVTEAFDKSKDDAGLRGQRFAPWEGRGRFGVQMRDTHAAALFGDSCGMARLRKLDPQGRTTPGSRRDNRHELLVRIGSDDRAPVWAAFKLILHRPLPPTALVNRVTVSCERIGVRDVWHAVFTCVVDDCAYRVQAPATVGGTVAVDVGWRADADSVRVAYAVDARGRQTVVRLPHVLGRDGIKRPLRERYEHARSLQGIVSRDFCAEDKDAGLRGGALHDLADWLDRRKQVGESVPEWLAEAHSSMRQWRSQRRLALLVERWSRERFRGDEDIYDRLNGAKTGWRHRWRHLHGWSEDEKAKGLRVRREHYRMAALDLARKYDTILINNADLAALRRRKPAKAEDGLVLVADARMSQAFDAAPGELREEIVKAAKKHGRTVIKVAFDTLSCSYCGQRCDFDRAKVLRHTCEHCGVEWDQDRNACRNALRERDGGVRDAGGARNDGNAAESLETAER